MKILGLLFSILITSPVFSSIDDPKKLNYIQLFINPEINSTYKVIFHSHMATLIKVNIYDEKNNFVFADNLGVLRSFKKKYNFNHLPTGKYSVEIISNRERIFKEFNHTAVGTGQDRISAHAIKVGENNEYELTVSSKSEMPMWVYIFNQEDRLVHKEKIEVKERFQKVYHMSAIKSNSFSFVIKTAESTITAVEGDISHVNKSYFTLN